MPVKKAIQVGKVLGTSYKLPPELTKLIAKEKRIVHFPETLGILGNPEMLRELLKNPNSFKNLNIMIAPKTGR